MTLCHKASPGRVAGATRDACVHGEELFQGSMSLCHERGHFRLSKRKLAVTSTVVCSRWMTPDAASSPHSLASATGLLLGSLGLAMAVGAVLGWAVGSWDIGLLIGAVAGIPLAVGVVYLVYTRAGRG